MKIFCLILGSLLIFSCCSQEQNELAPKRTVIAGIVKNLSDKANVLVVNFCDPINKEELQFAQNLSESAGRFQIEHKYTFSQNITIRFANKFINLLIHPGDSVFVTIDADKITTNLNDAVTFLGDNADLNKELFIWTNNQYQSYNSLPIDNSTSPGNFIKIISSDFETAKDSIKAYSLRTKMSSFLEKWAFIDYKFIQANLLMDYNYPGVNKWDVFTDPIFDVFNEDNFQTMYFQYHLSVCIDALIQSESEIKQMFSEKKHTLAIQLTIEKLSEKAPKGIVQDVMLFDFLRNILKENVLVYDSLPETKTAFSNPFFSKELERLFKGDKKNEESQMLSETEKTLTGILHINNGNTEKVSDAKLLNYLSDKYKDRVLYIDIWATWCGPCIKEFEFTPNLHKYFKDKDVVFINICLESTIENWEQAITKHKINGENYYLDANSSNLFRAENNLSGFPSYLIIDKNGKVHTLAPRPSNLEYAIQNIELCLN